MIHCATPAWYDFDAMICILKLAWLFLSIVKKENLDDR